MNPALIPDLPVDAAMKAAIRWLIDNLDALWNLISLVGSTLFDWLSAVLLAPPAIALILLAGILALLVRSWKFAAFTLLSLAFVEAMGMWMATMETLALIIIAALVSAAFSIPIGILAARNRQVSTTVRPVLDFMQTMHPLVYLIPAVLILGIGPPPGIVSTVIFAMPPGVRLTELGIRQVDKEVVEAGEAFGARPRQILARIQVPLALPSILAGINQIIMLSLSMVVLAGLVGAPGLGQKIISALGTLDTGKAFEAGFAIVILAILLDRLTGAIGRAREAPQRKRLRTKALTRAIPSSGIAPEGEKK